MTNLEFNDLGVGVKIKNSERDILSNLNFENCRYGIYFEDNALNVFVEQFSMINMYLGVQIIAVSQRCEGLTFSNGLIWNSSYAVNMTEGRLIVFDKCIFETLDYNTRIYGGLEVTIDDSWIHAEGDHIGVYISPQKAAIDKVTIENTVFYRCGLWGVCAEYNAGYGNPKNVQLLYNKFDYDGKAGTSSGDIYFYAVRQAQIIGNEFATTLVGQNIIKMESTNNNLMVLNNNFASSGAIAWGTETSRTVKNNIGYVTENSGTSTISASTAVTFNHGLAGTPTYVNVGFKTSGYGSWSWFATSTQISITVENTGNYDLTWYAEYKP